jgi:hypothetical protein
MSEFKGTKGKWEVNPRASRNVRCNNLTVANCSQGQDGENEIEEKHNALLISKAPDLLEELDKARQIIRSLKLSMLGHPDCTYNSEFDDLTTKAQQSEDEIEKVIKGATEL